MSINTISQWVGIQANQLTFITIIGYKLIIFTELGSIYEKPILHSGPFSLADLILTLP